MDKFEAKVVPTLCEAVRCALEARSEAVRVQDAVGEARGWKFFCLLPVRLLRRGAGTYRVVKEELFQKFAKV